MQRKTRSKTPRRRSAHQRGRRQAERLARRSAVGFVRWLEVCGHSRRTAADSLGLGTATVGRWVRRWREDRLRIRPRGRPLISAEGDTRRTVLAWMSLMGPHVGLPVLRAEFTYVGRAELVDLQRRLRRLWRRKNVKVVHVLRWTRPGSVWAMDHAKPPAPIDGVYDRLLLQRDLAARNQLAALPVADENADTVASQLEAEIVWHGAPLVVKNDNGSAYRAETVKTLLRGHDVLQLFSPPATPSYNGSCEAGIGSIKTRAHHEAARQDRPGQWTCDDIEAARCQANETARPWGWTGPTPQEAFEKRVPITEVERRMFLASYEAYARSERQERGYDPHAELDHYQRAAVDRVAIVRALVEHGYLQFRRRRITPPFVRKKTIRIS